MLKKSLLIMLLLALFAPWAAQAQSTLTVCEGTTTNEFIPVYGYYADTQGTDSEFIIPSSELTAMNGMDITAMSFYISSAASAAWGATFQVYMKEVEETTLSGVNGPTGCTVVYTGALDGTGSMMDVTFDDNYTYHGGNLLIGTYVTSKGSWKHAYFYGIEATGAAYCHYTSSSSTNNVAQDFLPKTTFTYQVPASCPKPTGLAVNYTGGLTAEVSWTSDATAWNIDVNGTQTAITTNPYTLTGLEWATFYTVKVQADCGTNGTSDWSASQSFLTNCADEDMCNIVYELTDSYGDGWTGNAIQVVDNATSAVIATLTVPDGSSATGSLPVCDGRDIDFVWVKGSYPDECSWVIYAADGTVISNEDDGSTFSNGDLIATYTVNCPSCLAPTDLIASDITTTAATLSWTAGGAETAWVLQYGTSNDFSTYTEVNVSANPTTPLSSLTSGTTHYVRVKADCGSGDESAWSAVCSFNTECEAMPLPYLEPFDSDLSICWNLINTNTYYCNINIQLGALTFYNGSSSATLAAVLPEVDAAYPLNEYQIKFDACYYDYYGSMTEGKLRIGIMTDPTDFTTFELVQEVDIIDSYSTFGSYTVRLNNYTGTGQYIAIQDYYTQAGFVFVDNIEVKPIPDCWEPEDLEVSNVTNHTAQLDWTGTSDAYNIEYWTAAYLDPVFSEGFEDGIGDWTLVNTASSTGINSTPYSGSKSFRFSYNTTPPQYLISPELTGVTTDLTLEFYYKNYNSSFPETFMIGTSTEAATTAEDIEADFAFEAEITASDTKWHLYSTTIPAGTKYICWKYTSDDMYYLYIDDIVIGSPVAAGTPEQIQVTTNTKILTDLLAERKYEARVQSDCGSEGTSLWSDIVSFTTEIACAAPTGLSYSNVKSSEAELSWNSEADGWLLNYKVASDDSFGKLPLTSSDVIVDGNLITYTLTGLTPETEYVVKVCNDCGDDGTSEFTPTITFTTTAACPVPYNLDASNILHESATITWNGESDDYVVQYRTAASINGLSEDFGSSPTDWTFTTGALNTGGTATLSGTSSWSRGTNCGVFDSHIYMNMYGTKNYWLITPSLEVGDGYLLSMDIAYTKYSSGSTNTAPVTGCTTHRFAILISTDDKATWTILREWNNSGSAYVLDEVSQNGQSTGNIDLSAYAGQNAYIAFFGHSETSSYDNNFHFDNVTIGTPVPAGAWTAAEHTLETSQLNGLTAGTKYEVRVQGICGGTATDWSDLLSFTTVADNVKVFVTEGEWGEADNWDGGMPSLTDNVVLQQNATIGSGTVATANAINFGGKTLTIADGGQLQTNASVTATVKKHITGYDAANVNTNNGYYLIANPLYSTLYSDDIESSGLLTGTYDLYNWSPSYDEPWRNYKSGSFSLYTNYGYLYANQDDVDLSFTGTVRANNSSVSKSVNYSTTYDFGAFTLLGNPFVCDAYLVDNDDQPLDYYKMNDEGNGFVVVNSESTEPIAPAEGFFYYAEESGSVYFTREEPQVNQNNGLLAINLIEGGSRGVRVKDNAIVRFGEGNTLKKFQLNENSTKLYIPQDDKDYAVVYGEPEGEMPLNFKAETTRSYTIGMKTENVNLGYLHLIDLITGADVDMLAKGEYSFIGSPRDSENRFVVRFSENTNINTTDDCLLWCFPHSRGMHRCRTPSGFPMTPRTRRLFRVPSSPRLSSSARVRRRISY